MDARTINAIVVFAASFYAVFALVRLYLAYRRERAFRMAEARLNWRGATATEVEQPGWTDEQIHAFENRSPESFGVKFPVTGNDTVDGIPSGLYSELGNESEVEQERRLR